MKGFIEFTLILMLALFSPKIIELNNNIRNQIQNFARYKKDNKINSDLNHYISKNEITDYRLKYQVKEEVFLNKEYKIKNISIENKLSKILIETNLNRIFNWKKFIKSARQNKHCDYGDLEINQDTFFDCEYLKIAHLKVKQNLRLAALGKVEIDQLETKKGTLEFIAYENLSIKKINSLEYSSMLLFSQLGEVKLEQRPDCIALNLQTSDQNSNSSCSGMILASNYWPSLRIISTKLP